MSQYVSLVFINGFNILFGEVCISETNTKAAKENREQTQSREQEEEPVRGKRLLLTQHDASPVTSPNMNMSLSRFRSS